jgi:hypothetical protein
MLIIGKDLLIRIYQAMYYIFQTVCGTDNRIYFDSWLTDSAIFKIPAARTFYLYDPSLAGTSTCSISDMVPFLAQPIKVLELSNGASVAIYNDDIGTRMR